MILGDVCTRSCGFCAIRTGTPSPADSREPARVASAVRKLGLGYAVITSVNRDDLDDGGAEIWRQTIVEVRRVNPRIRIEVLIPDFAGNTEALEIVFSAGPDVIAHNLETVPRLYSSVRPQARFERSLRILREIERAGFVSKTGIMIGIGETRNEIFTLMDNVVGVGVSIMTIGQYLRPSLMHLPVARWISPGEFSELRVEGEKRGIPKLVSGPLVRSSYRAEESFRDSRREKG